ncbi:hypothetical protein BN1708_011812 [Verticillium longisporum]|uniref:Uncharacterized protein n=1 Tax=Verticillium longisporum TaxID=100787 RepID=A0A0G4L426_VERLO|nr:hypothetical protein BN1708_011812 [Verticillium longisporum]
MTASEAACILQVHRNS